MRTFSQALMEALTSRESGEIPVLLFTVTHNSLPAPIRISTDNADAFVVDGETVRGTISNGQQFLYLPMSPTLPKDVPDQPSSMQVVFDNIGQTMVEMFRTITSPANVTVQLVRAAAPDAIEAEIKFFQLTGSEIDQFTIVASLSVENIWQAPASTIRRRPANYPGCHA